MKIDDSGTTAILQPPQVFLSFFEIKNFDENKASLLSLICSDKFEINKKNVYDPVCLHK